MIDAKPIDVSAKWAECVVEGNLKRGKMTKGKKTPPIKPGEKVKDSGIYKDNSGRRSTLVEGEPAPPTSGKGQTWKQVVDTNKKN